MEVGQIIQWLVKEGDRVEEGQVILEVMTDKVAAESEAPASGTLGKIMVPEGETVPLVQVIAYIVEPDGEAPEEWPIPKPVKRLLHPRRLSRQRKWLLPRQPGD